MLMNGQFRGAGLLPNFLTTGTLICGFYAILMVEKGDHQAAFGYIVLAAVFDLLDGYVARILGAQSEFGAHYDSLSDAVAFGVAPAMLLFHWLRGISHLVADAPFAVQFFNLLAPIYLLCVIIRLARFNVTLGYDKRFFTGAPSPAAALAVCALVSLAMDPLVDLRHLMLGYNLSLIVLAFGVGLLMISRLPYPSFKSIKLSKKLMPFFMVLVLVLIVLSVQEIRWPLFLALLYTYAIALWHLVRSLTKLIREMRQPAQPRQ